MVPKHLKSGDSVFFVWCASPIVSVPSRMGNFGVHLANLPATFIGVEEGLIQLTMMDGDGKSADVFIPEGEIAFVVPKKNSETVRTVENIHRVQ